MYKDSSYKEKLIALKEWAPEIVDLIKKDLRNEHLKKDYGFLKKYFPGKAPQKVTPAEMAEAYLTAIEKEESGEAIAEFMANRWMLQSTDVYGFFESELMKVNPDFDRIETLDEAVAEALLNKAQAKFGALTTYLFSVINSVAFSKGQFSKLLEKARKEKTENKASAEKEAEVKSFEDMKRAFEERMLRLEDKYEKKLDGMQKKYHRDTEMLKKQVANLQRKLNG